MATEMAVGWAMAQQMMQQQGGALGPQSTPAAGAAPAQASSQGAGGTGLPNLLSPGEAAQILGVSEGDVLAVLESGELKGKKIGSTYRITRAALEEFLNS